MKGGASKRWLRLSPFKCVAFLLKSCRELSPTWWMLGCRAGSDKARLSEELQKAFCLPSSSPAFPACPHTSSAPSSAPDSAGIRHSPPWEGPFMAGAKSWGRFRAVWPRQVKNKENPRSEPGTDGKPEQLRLLWSPSSFVRV